MELARDVFTPKNADSLSHAYIAPKPLISTLAQAAVCSAVTGIKPCLKCTHCDKALRGIHPDINIVSRLKDKKEISIEQIRDLKRAIIVIPNDASRSVYIIEDADTMNKSAQNALLQMLEEPPAHVMFILSTENPLALLPTVRSRCVSLLALPQQPLSGDPKMHELVSEFYTALDYGNYELVTFMFKLEKLDKESMAEFIKSATTQSAVRLRAEMNGENSTKRKTFALTERVLARASEMLELNVSAGHISGMICAELLKS